MMLENFINNIIIYVNFQIQKSDSNICNEENIRRLGDIPSLM